MDPMTGTAVLWGAVVLAGVYHGLNPGMGWPLAVSAAMMEQGGAGPGRVVAATVPGASTRITPAPTAGSRAAVAGAAWIALTRALLALAAGHLLAMVAVLLPFSVLTALADAARPIRIVAGIVVIAFGGYLLITRRHPRFLARVSPSRLALWSFLAATAHGAGLMLVPLMLAMSSGVGEAALVSLVHTLAMAAAAAVAAIVVYRWLGLRLLTRAWFNLDAVWAASLVLVGSVGLVAALAAGGQGSHAGM
jgi:hypothetical protein